jgi:hypothetical protein
MQRLERPLAVLSNPDTAERSAASLDVLALRCCKSGTRCRAADLVKLFQPAPESPAAARTDVFPGEAKVPGGEAALAGSGEPSDEPSAVAAAADLQQIDQYKLECDRMRANLEASKWDENGYRIGRPHKSVFPWQPKQPCPLMALHERRLCRSSALHARQTAWRDVAARLTPGWHDAGRRIHQRGLHRV